MCLRERGRRPRWPSDKDLPAMEETQETGFQFLGGEDPLEEGIAAHSSTLAWEIPWTEEPGGLQSTGSQSQTRLSTHTERKPGGTVDPLPCDLWMVTLGRMTGGPAHKLLPKI